MRYFVTLAVALLLAACSRTPASRAQSQAEGSSKVLASDTQSPAVSAKEFLLTAAAKDFRAHGAPVSAHFRNVQFGQFVTATGAKQYVLCGEFLPQEQEGKADWMPFGTIKTSGYEQYVGAQAATFCQRPQVVWDKDSTLSSSLQNRFDSLQ